MKKIALGFVLLLLVVVLWVGSSTLIQEILTNENFDKPFFLTYFSTSNFSLYLISLTWKHKTLKLGTCPDLKSTAKIALHFCPLWFFANYFFNLSLSLTSVASNTILSSTSGMFTLLLSIFFLKESPEIIKFLAVITATGGVICIGLSDDEGGSDNAWGDLFALFGAIVYATYSVFIKAKASNVDMVIFFGCVGAINVFLLFPGFIILNFSGIEPFEFPSATTLGLLFLNALFGTVLSDMLWALSVRLLNPALCTVGLSLTIPLSMVVDTMLHQFTYSAVYILGALLIVLGFVLLSIYENPKLRAKISNESIFKILGINRNKETEVLLEKKETQEISMT
ncbi:unnamed protein product [Blepharisma stoltei]|uniref:EamA domain-containing protein n=1 Tax=Blepharisma stoltei TaxID=1481888 RepID=A0AAU9IX99_9CILI|nr:unnamed protein product [Blepharisma stoltei]